MKDAVLVVIGLLVGLGIGYAVWGGGADTADDGSGDDREPWPLTQCPPPPAPAQGTTAADKLNDVTNKAMAVPPPEQTPDTMYCMVKAQQVQMMQPMDPFAASGHALAAQVAAEAKDWGTCRNELDQIH